MKNKKNVVYPLIVLVLLVLLTIFSKDCLTAAKNGLKLCLETAVPSLFPFFVISALAVDTGLTALLGRFFTPVMKNLFSLPGHAAMAFVMGITGGYPVGAQTAAELYDASLCSKKETERMLSFCNNTGPAFIIGVCGTGIFGSFKVGLLLYFIHILSALIVGLIFRPAKVSRADAHTILLRQKNPVSINFIKSLIDAIKNGFLSCINVSAFVVFFSVVIAILNKTGLIAFLSAMLAPLFMLLGLPRDLCSVMLSGIVEMTNGLNLLSAMNENISVLLPTSAFLLGFGGFSVHCQTLSLLIPRNLSSTFYFWGKTLQGILSFVLCEALIALFPSAVSAFAPIGEAFPPPSAISFLSLAILLALFIPIEFLKTYGNGIKNHV